AHSSTSGTDPAGAACWPSLAGRQDVESAHDAECALWKAHQGVKATEQVLHAGRIEREHEAGREPAGLVRFDRARLVHEELAPRRGAGAAGGDDQRAGAEAVAIDDEAARRVEEFLVKLERIAARMVADDGVGVGRHGGEDESEKESRSAHARTSRAL